jgi:hypothetical protein
MDNNLGNVIKNAKARAAIYATYVIVGANQPSWLAIALAVYGYLGIPVGGLAAVNSQIVTAAVVEIPANTPTTTAVIGSAPVREDTL